MGDQTDIHQTDSENLLILAGREILLFTSKKILNLNDLQVKTDLLSVSRKDFETKYGINIGYKTWTHLYQKILQLKYPPYQYQGKLLEYQKMVHQYLQCIKNFQDKKALSVYYFDLIRQLVLELSKIEGFDKKHIISLL